MTSTQDGLVQFSVVASAFASALAGLRPARPGKGPDEVVLGRISAALDRGEVSFSGAAVRFDAKVTAAGAALLPWVLLQRLQALAKQMGTQEVTVILRDGSLQLGPTSVSSAHVKVTSSDGRRPVLPIGASLLTVLSVGRNHSRDELEQWGVLERCEKAEEDAATRLTQAATVLAPLGISRELLELLVDAAVSCQGDSAPSEVQLLLSAWVNASQREGETS